MERNERVWILLVTGALLFFSFWPIIQNFQNTPNDRYYFGQSEFPLDMVGDLAYVQQGFHGNVLASFNYSTMIGGHPTILKFEYIAVGLLGRLFNIQPVFMFFISRLVISIGLLFIIYILVRHIFADVWQRIVSYLFVLFGAGITLPGTQNILKGYDVQVVVRLTQAMHHYLLGAGMMMLSLYFLSSVLEKPKRSVRFLLSLFFGVAASLIYAPDSMFLISGFPLYIVFDTVSAYFRTKRVRIDIAKIGILFAYSMVTVIPILYVRYVTMYIWNDINTVRMESLLPFSVLPSQYLFVAGMTYILSFIALPRVLRRGKPIVLMLATWLVMHPVGEFIVAPILHINYVYFLLRIMSRLAYLGPSGLPL